MNPDQILADLRAVIARIHSDAEEDEIYVADRSHDVLADIAEHFGDLDRWLCAGGHPPAAWRLTEL
ncbi:hypothetical protein [Nocardia pseudovaccinii]|uniref:hypothetical protein n=1 Tax=Nocardia pseudovaccinii TaxID=189540 RepID=UPI0007A4F7A3|nr:hypothetical protein [Nocardia pseudovaccinii]